jgi:hypothetical protein
MRFYDFKRFLSVSVGSVSATRRNYLSVRSVPISASHDTIFSVSHGENRRSDSVGQGRLRAQLRHSRPRSTSLVAGTLSDYNRLLGDIFQFTITFPNRAPNASHMGERYKQEIFSLEIIR